MTTQLDVLNAQIARAQKQKDLNAATLAESNARLDKQITDLEAEIEKLSSPQA